MQAKLNLPVSDFSQPPAPVKRRTLHTTGPPRTSITDCTPLPTCLAETAHRQFCGSSFRNSLRLEFPVSKNGGATIMHGHRLPSFPGEARRNLCGHNAVAPESRPIHGVSSQLRKPDATECSQRPTSVLSRCNSHIDACSREARGQV